ncbi:hypothetical protein [Roseibium litorale]|uniref:Uncharacterized protein n=1 Tax=Roseibium litorale TaxID=2803841 RepID=A0ABR9CPZ9_9HYPH|nr:hypothetical protein [Roseibium litorale]MBD8892921.1 hypothetical protein [Roseibium litorale]
MRQPLQNRVLPTGEIAAIAQRGLFMGNRGGRMHDPQTKRLTRKTHVSRRWICCTLEFKNRHRTVMGEGYTELFFLDEVTALAAGHRPCFECRRADALLYQAAFSKGNGFSCKATAGEMDSLLHEDRLDGKKQKTTLARENTLPDGVVAMIHGKPHAKHSGHWLLWTPDGYEGTDVALAETGDITRQVLTPRATVLALASGYEPSWHSSAARALQQS